MSNMWLIRYYPVEPNQEFIVYNISSCDPNDYAKSSAARALNEYCEARDRLYEHFGKPVPKIIGWNNSWFMISNKDSLKQTIEDFWKHLYNYLEGDIEYEHINLGNEVK